MELNLMTMKMNRVMVTIHFHQSEGEELVAAAALHPCDVSRFSSSSSSSSVAKTSASTKMSRMFDFDSLNPIPRVVPVTFNDDDDDDDDDDDVCYGEDDEDDEDDEKRRSTTLLRLIGGGGSSSAAAAAPV